MAIAPSGCRSEDESRPDHLAFQRDYAQRLLSDVLDWYRSAETKAQVILSLDGVLIGAFVGLTLTKSSDVSAVVHAFGNETWVLFAAAAISLLLSVAAAVACLVSRTYTDRGLKRFYHDLNIDPGDPKTYRAETLWFFQQIAGLDREAFKRALTTVDPEGELRTLGSQIHILSANVTHKHAWVNRAFFFSGLALVSLLVFGTDYLARVN
jgi:hypothetical protein